MQAIFLDFETYWDSNHTLSKMSPIEYVMHPETEIQSVSIKIGSEDTFVVFGEEKIGRTLRSIDWSNAMALGHNMSGFDAMILAWRFNINPKMYACTAAMARSKHSKTGVSVGGKFLTGVSLKKLAAEFGVGAKLDLEATNTKGKHLCDFTPQEIAAMAEYNKVDTDLCFELFRKMYPKFPKQEMELIDMTTRMLVEPRFLLDYDMVEDALKQVQAEKRESLVNLAKTLGLDVAHNAVELMGLDQPDLESDVRAMLASSAKFAQLLDTLGVPAPEKISKTTGKPTFALAKTDDEFIALQNHANPLVAAAARARLEVKSTLLETRLQAFMRAADACEGRVPVPLKYAGADTTGRWSGEQYNMQNLPRIGPKPKASDALRKSLLFRADPEKADLYKDFASSLYDVDLQGVTKEQRQVGKVAHLGLGFGAGAPAFKKVAKLMAGIDLSDGESVNIVNKWREEYVQIAEGWRPRR